MKTEWLTIVVIMAGVSGILGYKWTVTYDHCRTELKLGGPYCDQMRVLLYRLMIIERYNHG